MRYILILSLLVISGCASKANYFNNSDKILISKANTGVCKDYNYDCVVMSNGTLRDLSTINPSIKLIYVETITDQPK